MSESESELTGEASVLVLGLLLLHLVGSHTRILRHEGKKRKGGRRTQQLDSPTQRPLLSPDEAETVDVMSSEGGEEGTEGGQWR